MRRTPPVFWAEGMFLRPHHFQAADRYREEALKQDIRRLQPFFWGVMSLDIAPDQLENFTFEVRELEIKLKDGSSLSLSNNLRLFPRSFKGELDQSGGRMDVWLGVPVWKEAEANALFPGESPKGHERRFAAESIEVFDENVGANAQPIDTKKFNARVFFGNETREGYECVQIAVVERSGQGKNYPVLSKDFIPAVTEIGASQPLQALCEGVTNRLEAKHRLILQEVSSGKANMDSEGMGGWQLIMKLQTLGSFSFLLQQLTRIPRIHPFVVYAEFCRLMGELAIFDDSKKMLRAPLYDHDRLGPCFYEICHIIEMLAEKVVASRYVKVDFILREDLLVADLIPEWLAPETEVYLCIETDHEEKELRTRIETMKVGAVKDIPLLRQRRLFGLDCEMLKRVPSGLPAREDYYYFTIEKEGIYWANVVKDRHVAVSGGIDPKLKFCLYIVTKPGQKNG